MEGEVLNDMHRILYDIEIARRAKMDRTILDSLDARRRWTLRRIRRLERIVQMKEPFGR